MMDIEITPSAQKLEITFDNIMQVPVIIFNEVSRATDNSANKLRNEVLRAMRDTPKTGSHYYKQTLAEDKKTGGITRKSTGKIHIASSKGNAPAINTGNLRKNIIKDIRQRRDIRGMLHSIVYAVEVASGAPYAEELEDKNVLDRPIFRKIFDEMEPEIGEDILKYAETMTRTIRVDVKK